MEPDSNDGLKLTRSGIGTGLLNPSPSASSAPSADPKHLPTMIHPMHRFARLLAGLLFLTFTGTAAETTRLDLENLAIQGGIRDGKARLTLEAQIAGTANSSPALYSTSLDHSIHVLPSQITHSANATFDILRGQPAELRLTLLGPGEIKRVTGDSLLDWSVRNESNGSRSLVLRPVRSTPAPTRLSVVIEAVAQSGANLATTNPPLALLTFNPPHPALFQGHLRITSDPTLHLQPPNTAGIVPIEPRFLPESMRPADAAGDPVTLAFRMQGAPPLLSIVLRPADPDARRVVLRDFKLDGQLDPQSAAFTLTAIARVQDPRGGSIALLSGDVALSDLQASTNSRIHWRNGGFVLDFNQAGDFPVHLRFNAAVIQSNDWSRIRFRIAPASLQPVSLTGLAEETRLEFEGAARPVRTGPAFTSHLPPDGTVHLAWKSARPEAEGKLFYAAELLSQVTIGPGLMRQISRIDGRIMQGEMNGITLSIHGAGNITAVQGAQLLGWELQPSRTNGQRHLVVRFNQPRRDDFSLLIHLQSELPAFPHAVDAVAIRPLDATRFSGHFRVVNDGAVRLKVVTADGLSQVAPAQFPVTDSDPAFPIGSSTQRFVHRFSGTDFALRIQADNIQPEVSVSQVIHHHLGESALSIEADLELDIREAPLREVLVQIPRGFAIAQLDVPGLADYHVRDSADEPDAELRLIYTKPVIDRQLIRFKLERNSPLTLTNWSLPRISILRARSHRGHVAVSADPGLRIATERTVGLTDIATAFFPRKIAGIQAAFRITDPAWSADVRLERLPQSVQADVFHLFCIGEGIAYGSSTVNFLISGAPVSAFEISLSEEYFNIEFNGKDLRGNWHRTTNGYRVHLNTPVSGAYTLLATYERPFKAQGDTLTFTGARPLDAQSEQGHTLVVSAYQFQVSPSSVSPGLLALETAEVPPEYRLFSDAPNLAAYRYSSRPFNLQLTLSPLAQAETLALVIDRAALSTRVSKDGEVLTDVRYFIKNRGNPHLRVTLPEGLTLWSATVDGVTAVPVRDGVAHLIPLPPQADPNTVQILELKLASRSTNPARLTVRAPIAAAPVLLAEWSITPDAGRQLAYLGGSLTPTSGNVISTAASRLMSHLSHRANQSLFVLLFAFLLVAVLACRWTLTATPDSARFRIPIGTVLCCASLALAAFTLSRFNSTPSPEPNPAQAQLAFLAPVQQPDSALHIDLANQDANTSPPVTPAWPALLAVIIAAFALLRTQGLVRTFLIAIAWTLLGWATLRPDWSLAPFLTVLAAFLGIHLLWPTLARLQHLPPPPAVPPTPPAATVVPVLLFLLLLCPTPRAQAAPQDPPVAESVIQSVRVEDGFISATARIRWNALRNQSLPILSDPAVLTRARFDTNALRLVQSTQPNSPSRSLVATQDGTFEIEIDYQLSVSQPDGVPGFLLPTRHGLINRVDLTLHNLEVDVSSPAAVSVLRTAYTPHTVVQLVLSPARNTRITWQPRTRDVGNEKPVFFADTSHLFIPTAGLVEGIHLVHIRPAQGQLSELLLELPPEATVTDVNVVSEPDANPAPPRLALWRFDPDSRRLRITLAAAQSHPFTLRVLSQFATGALPMEQRIAVPSVLGSAGQLGAVGVATGTDVQIDRIEPDLFTPLQPDDFPTYSLLSTVPPETRPTLRRAFRHTDARGSLVLNVSAVVPDIRIDSQETLSLGEDRTVLAANLTAVITRAGIFRLSFLLPSGLDVETLSGPALSHWTELASDTGRVITLHLNGRTEGEHRFSIQLTGPGTRGLTSVTVPRLAIREASKQQGQLVVVPEQGLRLQIAQREGITQLDPERAGIRQKGVLAFRILQSAWNLQLDLEQVDAWVQVTGLQHVQLSEAQLKVTVNLLYQIENSGLKSLFLIVPTNAAGLRFRGDQVADFLPVPGSITNGLQTWEVKLHRRILGKYSLQATWQAPVPEAAQRIVLQGIQAADARLQRGFVTLQSSGRLQISAPDLPATVQSAEWQSIPSNLLQDLAGTPANLTLRVVDPGFSLPIQLVRHEATRLLPARVLRVALTSVLSDDGVMLTQARIDLIPGDKRLLHLSLPPDARFWFAFVNQNGVWPWREKEQFLIPLQQEALPDKPTSVEFFYSSRVGSPARRSLDLNLVGPQFDLPLEDITWQVYLDDKWELDDWSGTLQLQPGAQVVSGSVTTLKAYLDNEVFSNQAKTRAAEEMLQVGNRFLVEGDPQKARRAFQNAYGLSTHDNAFNEDARVQLHNLKLQQALVGLNVRQAAAAGESTPDVGNLRLLRSRPDVNYTQQEAQAILGSNNADDNATLQRLAERIIEQQDAAVPTPATIRATIPQQGRLLTFQRGVQIETWTDLQLRIQATPSQPPGTSTRLPLPVLLLGIPLLLTAFLQFRRLPTPR